VAKNVGRREARSRPGHSTGGTIKGRADGTEQKRIKRYRDCYYELGGGGEDLVWQSRKQKFKEGLVSSRGIEY